MPGRPSQAGGQPAAGRLHLALQAPGIAVHAGAGVPPGGSGAGTIRTADAGRAASVVRPAPPVRGVVDERRPSRPRITRHGAERSWISAEAQPLSAAKRLWRVEARALD